MTKFNYIYILTLIVFFICNISNAEHGESPKVITQQIKNWKLQCAEDHGKKLCEISEALQIPNSNYRFSIAHSYYINENEEKKENITFIVPLGANLKESLTLVFDDKETTDIAWAKCEAFGCIGLQTNNSSDKKEINQFNKIKSLLSKSKKVEMRIPTFTENPILIPADLDGYDQASAKMFAEEIF